MATERMIVAGRVQGVGYRAWTVGTARRLGIAGWVRNRSDGSVEILASAPGVVLDRFAGELRVGPRSAVVREVRRETAEAVDLSGFVQAPTV